MDFNSLMEAKPQHNSFSENNMHVFRFVTISRIK